MDNELLRNGAGYVDFTAYKAILNYQKGENVMEYNRGEIFEYEMANRFETKKALVVSADFRAGERYLSIIVLIDEPKGQVNVPIVCEGMMYADCGMVSFATNDRLGNFIRKATDAEMSQIDEGIAKCLGIKQKTVEITKEVPVIPVVGKTEMTANGITTEHSLAVEVVEELVAAKAEANVYKNLYEQLLEKMIG